MSLLAKTEFGVPRTVARVNHPKNEWLFNEVWGVDVAVSTPRLMSALVEEAVTVGDLVRLLTFHEGETNLVEMTLPDEQSVCRATDRRPDTCPGDVVLVAIIRDGHARATGSRRLAGGRRRTAVRHRAVLREGTGPDAVASRSVDRRRQTATPRSQPE